MTKSKLILIDTLATLGHVNWLAKLIKILKLDYEVTFVGENSICNRISSANVHTINFDLYNSKFTKSRFVRFYHSLRRQYEVKKLINGLPSETLIYFVGFENVPTALLGVSHRKVALHIHNNLELSWISRFALYRINRRHIFVTYEDYITQELRFKKRKSHTIPHTMNFGIVDRELAVKNYIFVMSKIFVEEHLEDLVTYARRRELKIIVRSDLSFRQYSDVVIARSFFDNYEDLLTYAKGVAIMAPYNFRVGGVFYEAMALKKRIVVLGQRGRFLTEMEKTFGDFMANVNELTELELEITDNIIKVYDNFMLRHSDMMIRSSFSGLIEQMKL